MDIDTKKTAEDAINTLMTGIQGEYNSILVSIAHTTGIVLMDTLPGVYSEMFPVEELVEKIKARIVTLENESREMAASYNAHLNTLAEALSLQHVTLGPYYHKDAVGTAVTEIRKEVVHLKTTVAAKEEIIKDAREHITGEAAVSHEACTFMAGLMNLLGKGNDVTPHARTCMEDRELKPEQVKAIGTELFEEVTRLAEECKRAVTVEGDITRAYAPVRWQDLRSLLGWFSWRDPLIGVFQKVCEPRSASPADVQALMIAVSDRIREERMLYNTELHSWPSQVLADAVNYLHTASKAEIRAHAGGEVLGYYMLVKDGPKMTMVDIASIASAKRVR